MFLLVSHQRRHYILLFVMLHFKTVGSTNATVWYQAYKEAMGTHFICCVLVSGLLTEAVMQIGSDNRKPLGWDFIPRSSGFGFGYRVLLTWNHCLTVIPVLRFSLETKTFNCVYAFFTNHFQSEGSVLSFSQELNETDLTNASPYRDYVFLRYSF